MSDSDSPVARMLLLPGRIHDHGQPERGGWLVGLHTILLACVIQVVSSPYQGRLSELTDFVEEEDAILASELLLGFGILTFLVM